MTVYVPLDLQDTPVKKKRRGRPKSSNIVRRLDIVRNESSKLSFPKKSPKKEKTNHASEEIKPNMSVKYPKSSQQVHIGVLPASPLEGFELREAKQVPGREINQKHNNILSDFVLEPLFKVPQAIDTTQEPIKTYLAV